MDQNRAKIFFLVAATIVFLLFMRILYLQFGGDEKLKARAKGNKIRTVLIEPSRGNIYDRNGILLVDNKHAYNLYVVPERILTHEHSLNFLSELLQENPDTLRKIIAAPGVKKDRYLRMRRDIDMELFSKVEERSSELFGVVVKEEWRRNFVKKTAPHVIGYLGEVKNHKYVTDEIKMGDLIGKEGVESVYDQLLRGKKGYRKELRDVRNNKISDYQKDEWIQAEKGDDLYLSIDYELQSFIEEMFKDKSGAVVVMNCNNGEILAMVSKPDFPLSIFSKRLTHEEWDYWSKDPLKPLYNKCIMGEYPPGSVLKMSSVMAALDQKIVTKKTKVYCPGGMQIGNRFIKCWNHSGHGYVNGIQAIMMSCDTYFYEIAKTINLDRWSEMLKNLGLGKKTGIDLRYERKGNIPNLEYYKKRVRGSLIGRFANLMIGQGEVLTTPLQICYNTVLLANKGIKVTPHLFYKSGKGKYYSEQEIDSLDLNKQDLKFVERGMYHVVNTDGGTGRRARKQNLIIAGKTGTAQNSHGNDHGWFTSYAPFDKPEIAVTIFEEFGLHGSGLTPYAKKIYEKWLALKQKQ